jgi:adenine-specific DNA glycosylase
MVRHQKGHKNSKGEKAEWVIVSHKDGHIISSHKTKEEAEKHLTDIRKFKHMGESMDINEAKQILNEAGFVYVDTERELERQKKFKERLETYFEDLADIRYAIKNSKAGLSNISMEEMSDYVEDETKFIYKMVRKFANKLEKDWDKCVKEDD